jgi:proteasome accessory factor C
VAEYYPCEEVTELGEGRLRVILRTPDSEWVRRLALRLGEDGRIVGPAEVVADVRREASAALAQYGSGAAGAGSAGGDGSPPRPPEW